MTKPCVRALRVLQRAMRVPAALALLLVLGVGVAERPARAQAPPAAASPEHIELLQKRNSLLGVIESVKRLRDELAALQAELASERGRGREAELVSGIQSTAERLAELERNFSEIATGVDPRSFEARSDEKLDFASELRDLLSPLIHELRRMTSRPREIDRLRSQISDSVDQLVTLERALANLARMLEYVEDPVIREALLVEQAEWEDRQEAVRTGLAVAQQKLAQKEADTTSLRDSVQGVFQLFFKSRGRNLLFALVATVVFLLFLRQLHLVLQQRGPLGATSPSFHARLFNLLYTVFTAVGGVLVFLIVLYAFGDWVLLILMIMLIMGLVWASKRALPAFWTQATLLLNMGVVREGERIVYQGVPFEVESLGFYTQLANPLLAGGRLRLPINDLSGLRSRPWDPAERWFPTREGEWVLLSSGVLGQVVHQSLEAVRVQLKGGAIRSFTSAAFLAENVISLSEGFRVTVSSGVDYAHVASAAHEIPERLKRFVADGLTRSSSAAAVRSVQAVFQTAAASSLDIAVVCDFDGSAAGEYEALRRLVNELCLDACNANGWTIPFQQVTVHMAGPAAAV